MFKPELFVGTVLFVWRASNHTIRTDTDSLLAAGLISIVGIAEVKYICSYIYTKANICKQIESYLKTVRDYFSTWPNLTWSCGS